MKINKKIIYTDSNVATLNTSTMNWEPTSPLLYKPNIKEWFTHNILRKHFTFGQPYCVVCGYEEL